MPFNFKELEIKDVILIEPIVFADNRGYFLEFYKRSEFVNFGISDLFIQDNHSKSQKGVLRGLHYQNTPRAQAKLIRCIKGEIFDVAVDIRKNSPTYKQWVGAKLSEENKSMLYIPVGFAHGFVVLSDIAEITYKVTEEFSPAHDAGVLWNDPEVNVDWGILDPIISEKDTKLPLLKDAVNDFIYDEEC
jgi:dTDP-4-dehydrorhamnose 3,5-epimerase